MPIWSRSSKIAAEMETTVSVQDPGDSAGNFLLPWLKQLGIHAGADTLLHFSPASANSIDLTHAHPSGLAQLLAGRRTRLSTLLRDPGQYAAAMKAARVLRAKIYEVGSERGIDVGYLAAGTAAWRSVDDEGRSESLTAPVLLTSVSLTVHASQDDYELQLTEHARLNPALVRHLRSAQGVTFDPESVAKLAYGTARFDPLPVLDKLRALTEGVRGMAIEHHLLVSTFADLADVADDPAIRTDHPVLAALVAAAKDGQVAPAASEASELAPPIDERLPADELLIRDADSAQQQVLDQIIQGRSLVVSAPPGSGQTQTALNAVAALAEQGKSVLVVAERRGTLNEVVQELDTLNLGSLVLQLNANINEQQLKDQLIRAIVRNEKATRPELDGLHKTLVDHRHQLLDHVKSLHNVRSRWGCSPYQAMQSLAELTSLNPSPATTVRLLRSVMDSIPDRAELAGRLRRAAELGSFSASAVESPWYGAKLLNRKETERAHELAVDLARDIPLLREKVLRVADHSQISLGGSFTEWGEQLELLAAVRASLDKFTPDIFDRPVTDLITATASSSWRRERAIEMSSMTRSRLRRVAKEYVRPGVHIADLHTSLVEVQQQRTLWTRYATTERHPSVPTGLAEINSFHHKIRRELDELTKVLATTPGHVDLAAMPLEELAYRLAELAKDKQTLATLPERTLLLDEMREHGLGELLDDLARREVGARQVGSELELAWWQSALDAMISGDDYLAMSDGESLRRLEADYRLADNAHIASGPGRLRFALAERWRTALAAHPAEAEKLRELLRTGTLDLAGLSAQDDDLVTALMPVWAASPLMLPMVLPADKTFDAVIVLDAESISLQSAVPALARATQVIAFGDDRLGGPQSFSVGAGAESLQEADQLTSAYSALSGVFPTSSLSVVYRGVDKALTGYLSDTFYDGRLSRLPHGSEVSGAGRALTVEYLPDGTGMPSADQAGVESVAAEVNRVVELVFEHIRRRPSSSLAVVTASARHAGRVGQAIRHRMAELPWAADFFAPGKESFRVVPVERAAGLTRDCVIFSLGFGRTPHGRALHNFGQLSGPDGRGRFVTAMTRARHQLHIVTCFLPTDLDPTRLDNGALDFYGLLERELGEPTGEIPVPAGETAALVNPDPLVADLVNRLRDRGAHVLDHYDGVLDIVATAGQGAGDKPAGESGSETQAPPMAIESDGTERYRTMTVRERSRLRPQLLERMGWRYMPLWTIEVFTDPNRCADLIGRYLGLPEVTGGRHSNSQGRTNMSGTDLSGSDKTKNDSVLPKRAAEDEAASWGERDESHEAWLKDQRPPHWD
ncbi:DUF4011 domain-containing protein [Arthrobacter flavus]|uniref:DUF4011 domain-containing protein n=2 Tax=Arthrobacter flavus TaxID=95172 RepID=A0ABW4Q1X4_9MICC